MSILFSSTALFTAARICAWLRETDGSSTIFACVTAAVTTRFSLTADGGSFGGASVGLAAGAGAAAGTPEARMSSWAAQETAAWFPNPPVCPAPPPPPGMGAGPGRIGRHHPAFDGGEPTAEFGDLTRE